MKATRAFLLLVGGLSVSFAYMVSASDRKESPVGGPVELATLMQAKLAGSQKITEGLVTKDFELIRKGAQEWRRIVVATKWNSHTDPVFLQHRAELSRMADKLLRSADAQDLDVATYAYFGALRTCIGCHEHCRDVLRVPALHPNPNAVVPIPVTDEEPANSAERSRAPSSR